MTAINCKHCAKSFDAEPNKPIAVCPHCRTIQSPPPKEGDKYVTCQECATAFFSTSIKPICPNCGSLASGKKKREDDDIKPEQATRFTPKDVLMEHTLDGFVISWAHRPAYEFILFAALIIGMMLLTVVGDSDFMPIFLIFTIPFSLALAVALLTMRNRQLVIIGEMAIRYTVAPINWFHEGVIVPLHDIANITVRENRKKRRTTGSTAVHAREIIITTTAGDEIVFLEQYDANFAKAVAHQLREFSGIDGDWEHERTIAPAPKAKVGAEPEPGSIVQKKVLHLARPTYMREIETDKALTLNWHVVHSTNGTIGVIFMALVSIGAIVASIAIAINQLSRTADPTVSFVGEGTFIFTFISLAFPLGLLVAGGVGLFFTMKNAMNQTWVQLKDKRLQVSTKPIRPTSRGFNTDTIQQIFVKERIKVTRSKNSTHYHYYYHLYGVMDGQREPVELLDKSSDVKLMLYLEQRLEDYLGIQNRLVEGEYGV